MGLMVVSLKGEMVGRGRGFVFGVKGGKGGLLKMISRPSMLVVPRG